jgi:hypothetical protein
MKKIQSLLFVLFITTLNFSTSKAQELPQPSSSAEIHQQVGLTNFVVSYSRPDVRGRDIFGSLVPYGKIWRAGANAATTIEFSSEVVFAGTKVEAGKYAIYVFPEAETWNIVLNSYWDTWGTNGYDPSKNIASFSGKVEKGASNVESFTIAFNAIDGDKAVLSFSWDEVMVNIDIDAPSNEAAKENIEEKLEELSDVFGTYNKIAKYYLETGDNVDALKYAQMSVDNKEVFWNVKVLSEAYAANGDYKKAIEVAKKSLKLAQDAEYQAYIDINTKNIAKWEAMK